MSTSSTLPPQVAADARSHLAALALLQEAQQYLKRLPTNPLTRALAAKIESHLLDPGATPRQQRLAEQRDAERHLATGLEGMSHFTPSGLPAIAVKLTGSTLFVQSPLLQSAGQLPRGDARKAIVAFEQALAAGMTVRLDPARHGRPTE